MKCIKRHILTGVLLAQAVGVLALGSGNRITAWQYLDATGSNASTDRLHIGNRWMSHSGLNWYDNTARMHDPVLMHFATPDPLYAKYQDLSPWSHCAANPLNIIDPSGMDHWQVDDRGYLSLKEQTDDEFDVIFGRDDASIQVEKGFVKPVFDGIRESIDNEQYQVSIYKAENNGQKIFEFLSENSDVEWSNVRILSGYNFIGTSHDENRDGSVSILSEKFKEEFD